MICFVHIERAGGTTLHEVLRTNFPSYLMITPCHPWTNEESNVFTRQEFKLLRRLLPFTKGIGGHTTRPYLGYEEFCPEGVEYITFLRDPVDRYLSHYIYQKYKKKINWSFEKFLQEKRFDNFMTKRLAGTFDVELAKKNLVTKFKFVGITEEFDLSLLILKKELGLPRFQCCYKKMNSGTANKAHESLSELKEKYLFDIESVNKLDMELYNYANDNIFNKYKSKYDLVDELQQLKISNLSYKYNIIKRKAWYAYRKYAYMNIEKTLYKIYH